VGSLFRQPKLASTLERLAAAGLDDFYRGEIGAANAAELSRVGSPMTAADLAAHRAVETAPLSVALRCGTVYNVPFPTQGLASLLILAPSTGSVARKRGFSLRARTRRIHEAGVPGPGPDRDRPRLCQRGPGRLPHGCALAKMAKQVNPVTALPWPAPLPGGDTVWLGVIDGQGRAVSLIQSIYWSSARAWCSRTRVSCGRIGVRASRSRERLECAAPRPQAVPYAESRHGAARGRTADGVRHDGRRGAAQTQAALFARHVPLRPGTAGGRHGAAMVLGRTWGATSTNLKLESRFDPSVIHALRKAGTTSRSVAPFTDQMGHAGAIVRQSSGVLEGAADPRGDGLVATF